MKTVRELKSMADELLLAGSYMEALHAYCALLDLQPLHLDARLRVADALLALGEVQRAALVYTSLARHSANAGYPLHAIMALKILSQLDPQFVGLLKSVAELYANGSPRLGRGARMAPPDPEQEVPPDLELQLSVSWDLGEIAYHPESIDVSREAREIIELRDDVLDEITQLYFERRRVIAAFASQPDSPAAAEYKLRAAQLAAGIDAWTGGWFGRQLAATTP